MWTHRIIYIFTLVGSVLFYILYSYWFSWYLLVLILLLMPFDLLISLPGMLTRRIILTAPNILEQSAEGLVTVTALQLSAFPVKCVRAWVHVVCDDFSVWWRAVCGAERGVGYELIIDTSRTGVTVFEIKRFRIVSLIGLFSMPVRTNCKAAVLILPAPRKPPNTISLPRGAALRPKPGGGFSEDHDLRPYRHGDPLRSIHWKVSAKHDSLIVREPLVPELHSRLVRVMRWTEPLERDLILSRLLWISGYLLGLDMYYYIRFGDDGPVAEITRKNDLEDYLYHVLSGAPDLPSAVVSLPARFTWEFCVDASEDVQ